MKELYRRYVSSSVRGLPERRARVHSVLCDTFHEAHLEMEVDRNTTGIIKVSGEMTRAPHYDFCAQTVGMLDRLVGLKATFGTARAIRDAVSGSEGCSRWEELALSAVGAFMDGNDALNYHEMPPEGKSSEAVLSMLPDNFKNICFARSHADDPDYPVVPPMPHPAREAFHRIVFSCVRLAGKRTLWVEASISDSIHELRIDMDVELPSRLITRINGEFTRFPHGERCLDTVKNLQELVGQIAWPGQNKLIRQMVGGSNGCSRFEELVIEAYRSVMQAHYPLTQKYFRHDPRQGRHIMFGFLKDTCRAYSAFKNDPEWNSEICGTGKGIS
ncbi:MAG: DUF2889 domain-containing protein [Bacillota bacterium]